jgi:hypothetical protein
MPGFNEYETAVICDAISSISVECTAMHDYLYALFESGRMYASELEDQWAYSEWHVGTPFDPNAFMEINTSVSGWEAEIGNTLRHEFGHLANADDDEGLADSYMGICQMS